MAALVIGHKNPDTDSIVSAIAVADLMSKLGIPARPVAQGPVTPETAFVLDAFGLARPEVVTSVAGRKVILVDHSDAGLAPSDLQDAEVIAVVDHHKLGSVTTASPLLMWVWPVGCTATVIKAMYDFHGVEVPRNIAGGLLAAILSDTVIFKSPTTTDDDKKAAEVLAGIAGVSDCKSFGMEMFTVKSAVDGIPARELLFRDYKEFDMSGAKVGISQIEVIDLALLDKVKTSLAAEIAGIKAERGAHSVFLLLTDIVKEGSEMLFSSDNPALLKEAFGLDSDRPAWLPGIISCKKDVTPKIEAALKARLNH